jgi:hypothetical protein
MGILFGILAVAGFVTQIVFLFFDDDYNKYRLVSMCMGPGIVFCAIFGMWNIKWNPYIVEVYCNRS